MRKPGARLGDIDTGHPGAGPTPVITASNNVFINGKPAARLGDKLRKHHKGERVITSGSATVFINGKPAARVGDTINCGGVIIQGSSNVFIGDSPELMAPSEATQPELEYSQQNESQNTAHTPGEQSVISDVENVKLQENALQQTPEIEPELAPVGIRIAISPQSDLYQDTQFILTSTDGSITQTKTVADDQKPGDNFLDLQFDDLDTNKNYTLKQIDGDGSTLTHFDNFSHGSIGVQCPPSKKNEEENSPHQE